jgi:hypothetical protein
LDDNDISDIHFAATFWVQNASYPLKTGFSLGLLFVLDDGGIVFLRNVSGLAIDCMTLYSRRQKSS